MGKEKVFDGVNIAYRKPYLKPEEIQNLLAFFHAITLQTKAGVIERAVIGLNNDKVSSIEIGGALLDQASK